MSTPTYTAYATPQTEVGLAIEQTPGTPVTPAFWVPVKAPKYKPDLTLIADNTLQGSMVENYDMIAGLRYDSHGWDSFPYLDSFPVLVRAELGSSDTIVTAPTATTLSAAASAGATTVTVATTVAKGSWIVIGSGSTLETHQVTSVSTDTLTLNSPLIYAQASGATVTGLTQHQFSLLNNAGSGNQPPTVTITDYDGEEWRQLSRSQLDKLTIKGTADGLLDYTCSWFANAATTPTTPTPSYTTARAVPGWSSVVTLGGTQVTDFVDWEIDFGRGVKPIPAFTGTQEYFMYFAGPLTATAKITVIEQSGAPELTDYLSATKQSFDISVFDRSTGDAMDIHCTDAIFTTGDLDRSKEWVQATLDVQFLPSAADAQAGGVSPVLVTVANAQTTTY